MLKQNYLFLLMLSLAMHIHLDAAQMNVDVKEQEEEQLSAEEQAAVKEMFAIVSEKNVSDKAKQAQKLQHLLQRYPTIINQKDEHGDTTLMLATYWGRTNIIQLLIAAGADEYIRNKENKTARDFAIERGFSKEHQAAVESGENERLLRYATRKELEQYMIPDLAKITTEYTFSPQTTSDLAEKQYTKSKVCIVQ